MNHLDLRAILKFCTNKKLFTLLLSDIDFTNVLHLCDCANYVNCQTSRIHV